MKNLNSFILGESENNLIPKVQDYLNLIGEKNLVNVINSTIEDVNGVIESFKKENVLEFINGHVIGRIIEKKLAGCINKTNGFEFQQGAENRTDKDIICTKCPDDKNPSYYSLECKTSLGPGITGNKSYAQDKKSENSKDKNSFYILINNYKKVDTIKTYNAYFGFIEQKDWQFGNKGNASRISISRLIEEGKLKKLI